MEKEKEFEFLFIDIEWNQKKGTTDIENCEPIQIGIIGTDENLECIKLFSKNIALENIDTLTDETCKISHITKSVLLQAKTEKEIFEKIKSCFPNYKYIVVWKITTYEIFKKSMNKCGIKMSKHKVLVLQDILSRIALQKEKSIGIEGALIRAKIPYEKSYLHYSKHDVKYLHELFKYLYLNYTILTKHDMCVVNDKSKIIHACDCKYLKTIKVVKEENKKNMIFFGYRPCICCSTEEMWRKIQWKPISKKKRKKLKENEMRKLPLTDVNIRLICRQYNMMCRIGENVIFLTTNYGHWRIYLNGEKVKQVYHENYRVNKKNYKIHKKTNEGFHKQDILIENFHDVISYIYYHDKYSYTNRKKSRIEELFDKIEQERILKEGKE